MTILAIAALALWLTIFLLPWRPWLVREQFEVDSLGVRVDLQHVTVLIPVRNEEVGHKEHFGGSVESGTGLVRRW